MTGLRGKYRKIDQAERIMKRILITGKDSYIGTSVEAYLNRWPDRYSVAAIDVRGGYWNDASFEGYDTVYHVAGIAHSDTRKVSAEEQEKYYAVNTELTLDVAKKAKEDGVRQFLFMSSVIVYGESAPIGKIKVIKADTPLAPANFYGDSKRKAEEGLWKLRSSDFRVVVLRSPMVYGRGSKGSYPQLRKIAQKLKFFPDIKNQRSMLYITNLCEFVRLMIDNEEAGIFFPQNKEYMNTSKLVRAIGKVHEKKVVLVPGTEPLLNMLGNFMPLVNKAFGNLVIDKSLSRYKEDYQLIGAVQSIREAESKSACIGS